MKDLKINKLHKDVYIKQNIKIKVPYFPGYQMHPGFTAKVFREQKTVILQKI
jgi:hypothetical protein